VTDDLHPRLRENPGDLAADSTRRADYQSSKHPHHRHNISRET